MASDADDCFLNSIVHNWTPSNDTRAIPSFAVYLLYTGQMVIRNPSAINEFWLDFETKRKLKGSV